MYCFLYLPNLIQDILKVWFLGLGLLDGSSIILEDCLGGPKKIFQLGRES